MQNLILPNSRLNGLDTLRCFAIIIVLLFHYMLVVSNENTFGYATRVGWMGVDLFFVLSGYLIGNQVLSALAKQQEFSLKHFYIRRLLRTLPNYYVVLALYFIFPVVLAGVATSPAWKFLIFIQNLEFRPFVTFSHSWSLCIEEQFYLIFPIIFLLIAKFKKIIPLAWSLIIGGMLLGVVTRIVMWFKYGEATMNFKDYYEHIYYSSFTRFDELLPGIAIAMLKNFHARSFSKIMRHANWLLCSGLVTTGVMFYVFPNFHSTEEHGYNFFLSSFGYSLLSLSFSLLILSALSPTSIINKFRIPGATQLALWSYAIYLIHKPLFKLLIEPLTKNNIDVKSNLGVFIIMSLSILAGWLLFRCVETPFMNLRNKYYSSNIAKNEISVSLPTTSAVQ
jgi:peptidoglycan/LPS O-acetylase OafA/YrhL